MTPTANNRRVLQRGGRAVTPTANIGVTCNVEVVRYGLWSEPAAMVPFTYVTAIAAGSDQRP